ncbi:MAG: tetratricopeptide repeat protein [Polyangiaceae bacterium]|nr:tetratricopeptide repeat protein [Polyangiaceae bacterium]MCW5789625.1 tetratricopeptide repeat protein [Polyangiaceae bacterium]
MAVDREKSLQAAQKYIDKKRYDRAIEEYQRIVQADPNDARTLLKIGDLQARTQAYTDAIATYDRVGQFYSSQGFALKAIAVYKQIRELIRNHVPHLADHYAHIVPRLAEIYSQLGLTTDALAAYDEVATRFQKSGRDAEAISVFERMVELDRNNPLPHLRLAEARCRVQAVDEAIGSFWAAAELLLELRRRDDALKVVERILHFRQETKYSLLAAELYIQRGGQQDGLQALAKLQTAFQKEPRNLDVLSLLAQAFTLIGQQAKAVEVYKEMARLAREQGDAELFQQLIGHLMSVAPHDEAVTALARLAPASTAPGSVNPGSVGPGSVNPGSARAGSAAAPISIAPDSVPDDEIESVRPVAAPRVAEPPMRAPRHSAPDVVVVDDALEAAEELGEPGSFDGSHHTRKALVDAESFRRLRLYSKALETLRIALEIDPRGIALREKLRDVLWEAGDPDASIGEMITLAAIHLDEERLEHAEAQLYAVLEAEPNHAVAHQMLAQISGEAYVEDYAEDDEATAYAGAAYEDYQGTADYTEPQAHPHGGQAGYGYEDYGPQSQRGGYPAPQVRYAPEGYDPNEPLPSYDLEEVGASEALASDRPRPDPFEVDDPFGDAPLPSFPLSADEDDLTAGLSEHGHELPPEAAGSYGLPSFDDLDAELEDAGGADFDDAPRLSSTGLDPSQTEQVEEALDEAEFFATRGLWEDAKLIVEDQLRRVPGHPLLLERLHEIEQSIEAQTESESGARVARGAHAEVEDYGASELDPSDDAFDIAASLGALDELEAPVATRSRSSDDVDVDQVFAKFKEGVRAQVSDQDSATHYDLGVAYKEMGLLNDAVGEFELAARDPARECMCYAMIGMVYLEGGDLDRSAEAYVRGLAARQKTAEQEMSLYYDLGIVYEMKQSVAEALYYFEKIARRDPSYRDVEERIAALKPATAHASATRAVGDDDEFDAVFDDLFESK